MAIMTTVSSQLVRRLAGGRSLALADLATSEAVSTTLMIGAPSVGC